LLGDLCSGGYDLARAGKKSVSGRITLRFMMMAFLAQRSDNVAAQKDI